MQSNRPVTAFSHLRWDFVYRRPQHLLSRLASGHRVIFVEEPVTGSGEKPAWEFSTPEPGILVCRPHTPSDSPGYSAQQLPYIKQLLHEFLERENLDSYLLWFYTPMALPISLGTSCSPITPTCIGSIECCSVRTSTGRIANGGSTKSRNAQWAVHPIGLRAS